MATAKGANMRTQNTKSGPEKPDGSTLYTAAGREYLGKLGEAWHLAVHAGDYDEADRVASRYHYASRGWSMGAGRYH